MRCLEKIINLNRNLVLKKKIIRVKVAPKTIILFCFLIFAILVSSCGSVISKKLKEGDTLLYDRNESGRNIKFFGSSEPEKELFSFESPSIIINPIKFDGNKKYLLFLRIKGQVTMSLWIIDGIKGEAKEIFNGYNSFKMDSSEKYICIFEAIPNDQDTSGISGVNKLNIYIYDIESNSFVSKFTLPFYKFPTWYTKKNIEESTEPFYEEKTKSFVFKIINADDYIETYQIKLSELKMERVEITKSPHEYYSGM